MSMHHYECVALCFVNIPQQTRSRAAAPRLRKPSVGARQVASNSPDPGTARLPVNSRQTVNVPAPVSRTKLRSIKVKVLYSHLWKYSMTQLWSVTCHMGSQGVTCYPTQVNTPRLNPSHAGRYLIYLTRRDGRLS